ncbi:hypothetical protein [Anaerotruncus rubiinfantis]|uniref:hypothetical protein n=1 Tax=Anaerotruncus rubiinfantis TaxID=1720200 RepID=UPI0011C895FC|nr:hypothetical protein [Anaerotruncus rubiinfantis]
MISQAELLLPYVEGDPRSHSKWRQMIAEELAKKADFRMLGIKAINLFGSADLEQAVQNSAKESSPAEYMTNKGIFRFDKDSFICLKAS